MKVTDRRDVKAEEGRNTKERIAAERETSFRQGETDRKAAKDLKTARLKALRLAPYD